MSVFVPVVLSGGAGTRLWPVSREALPKPFIKLPDGESLLRKTFQRATALSGVEQVLTITSREYYFLSQDEFALLKKPRARLDFLLEPQARNTAPAIGAAALHLARQHGEDAVLLVLPADHLISDARAFGAAVEEARRLAKEGWLVTFGVEPMAPETVFGYIEAGEALGPHAAKVARFVEKPDADKARGYLATGRFTWNAGMFCATAGAVLKALAGHAPEGHRGLEATFAG